MGNDQIVFLYHLQLLSSVMAVFTAEKIYMVIKEMMMVIMMLAKLLMMMAIMVIGDEDGNDEAKNLFCSFPPLCIPQCPTSGGCSPCSCRPGWER